MINIVNRVMIMMMVVVVMGCNSGRVAGGEGTGGGDGRGLSGAMMEVGRSAENAFYAFLELVSDVLGFAAKATTKKNEVGEYFNSLGIKLEKASEELEEVAKKSETGGDKSDLLKNSIREAVNSSKEVLDTLKGHLKSLGQVGDNKVVGEANNVQGIGTAPDEPQLKAIFNILKGIVEISTNLGITALKTGVTTLTVNGGADNKEGAKILSTDSNPEATDAGKAAVILASVSGDEILASIVKSGENDAKLSNNADDATTAMSFARGGSAAHLAGNTNAKAAAVAGGIALRSLVKDGKLASGAADNVTGGGKEVQGVGITAVNKLLVAVEDIIKKTVKETLKKAKEKIDESRSPKAADQQ
ncbi:Variable major outer membrane lipoprotein [Borrelia duttonii CR2A]|uniref:Variable large protein n=1 Tax=Borrelia duttonii CR2A TaxID=1432657 RepID=W6TJG0_9SPIR|nr:variable large family protein [Borrelia duttonii]ETZ17304.1 Variable major outer membrane lipoprotein [Borrelia duttonii CR2A]